MFKNVALNGYDIVFITMNSRTQLWQSNAISMRHCMYCCSGRTWNDVMPFVTLFMTHPAETAAGPVVRNPSFDQSTRSLPSLKSERSGHTAQKNNSHGPWLVILANQKALDQRSQKYAPCLSISARRASLRDQALLLHVLAPKVKL